MPYLTKEEIDSGVLKRFEQFDPEEVEKNHKLAWENAPGYRELFDEPEKFEPGKNTTVAPERGFFGDVASNLARGVGDLARMGGHALKTLDPDGGIDILEKAGQKMIDATDYAEKNLDIMKQDQSEAAGEGFWSRGWKGGVRSAVPSVAPVVAGGLAGSAFGPVGTLIGAGVGTLGLFGLGVYGEKKQEYLDQGIGESEAEKAAFKQALIEGGIETAGSLIGLKIFGVDKFITQPLKQTLKELIETPVATWGKKLATDAFLNEIPTEMLQEALGAQVETGLGLQDEGAWKQAAVEAIVPAMVMSLGFGIGSQGLTMVQKRRLKNQINNLEDPNARLKAVEEIEKGILAHEKAGEDTELTKNAEAWSTMAMDRIEQGLPIELNTDFVEYATNDEDTLNQARARVAKGQTMEYRGRLVQRIDNLSRFKALTPRQKELQQQYLSELADLDIQIAEQKSGKTESVQPKGLDLMGQEADQFDQFQEGFRDQKIDEFEQNLKQAQEDIQEYPDRPPIQPDTDVLRKEWEAKQEEEQKGRRNLMADESDTFDDFLYKVQADAFESELKKAQADIKEYKSQPPIQPDVKALRREYEARKAERLDTQTVKPENTLNREKTENSEDQPKSLDQSESDVKESFTTESPDVSEQSAVGLKDKEQQAFVDQRIKKLGSIEAVDQAYNRDDQVSRYARVKARAVFGGDVEQTAAPQKSKGHIGFFTRPNTNEQVEVYQTSDGDIYTAPVSNVLDIDTGNRIGRFEAPKHMAGRAIENLLNTASGTSESNAPSVATDPRIIKQLQRTGTASKGDVSVKIVTQGANGFGVETTVKGDRRLPTEAAMTLKQARAFAIEQLDNPRPNNQAHGSTDKKNLTVSPGAVVTWKDKKGRPFSGEIIQKQGNKGKIWQVRKADGKTTLVHEKQLSLTEQAPVKVQTDNLETAPQQNIADDILSNTLATDDSGVEIRNDTDKLKAQRKLDIKNYHGTKGDRTHTTRTEKGMIPVSDISHLQGESGEVRGEHRNRNGEDWDEFKRDIFQNGIKNPIMILKDPGKKAVVSEGNHRLDAAIELGLKEVPVDIRYFGHSEEDGLVYGKHVEKQISGSQNQKNDPQAGFDLTDELRDYTNPIGKNIEGKNVYQDEKGVRSYEDSPGLLSKQKIKFVPGGTSTFETPQSLYSNGEYDYLTENELNNFKEAASKDNKDKSFVSEPSIGMGYGTKNKIFTADAAEKARELLRKKLSGNQLNSGIDPEILLSGIQLGGYHIEAGARTFAEYSKAMIQDVGEAVKPYLRSFYEGVRHFPDFDSKGMTSTHELDEITGNADNTEKPTTKETANDTTEQRGSGIQSLDRERGQAVSGDQRRGGRISEVGENGSAEKHDRVLAVPLSEDARQVETDGSVEGDRLGVDLQESGNSGEVSQIRNELVGREDSGGTGLVDHGPGRGRDRGRERDRLLSNYHIEDPEALIGGTSKVRFQKNQSAIETFNQVSNDGRQPTAEERDAMAAYIGWGSFGQELFQGSWDHPIYKKGWQKENDWLRQHLGEAAWKSARDSIINAHYTDPPTVSAIWHIARKLGFKGGRVLEPSMGIGNFFGLMPKDLKSKSDLTGIELDETTAGMAKMLYPGANIQQMGYQESKTADGFYDLVLGNWPFAADGPADRRYNKYRLTLHDYFFIKTLDQVRPGGFVIGITASGSMDKVGKIARRQMEKRADLVAAFRMPTGAFKEYAGTSVVADIIILQKRAEGAEIKHDAPWMDNTVLGKAADGREVKVNEYWTHKPDHVLGNMNIGHGTTQGREGMIVERKQDYDQVLSGLTDRLPKNIMTPRGQIDHIHYITNNTKNRQNSVTIAEDGRLYVVTGERLAPLNEVYQYSVKNAHTTVDRESQLKALVKIRNKYGQLLDAERDGDKTTEDLRKKLNLLYQAFVKKHGSINESFALKHFNKAGDPMAPAMAALENNTGTKENPVYEPAKIFTESTQRQKARIENPTISDAFVLARNEVARSVDIDAIAEKAGVTPEAVKAELIKKDAIFETPAGTFEVKDIYLSGNVRQKLRDAKDAQEQGMNMTRNIKALEAVLPDDIPYFNIEPSLGATWIPADTYRQFIAETANLPEEIAQGIRLTPSINGWIVKFDDAGQIDSREEARTIWSTPGASFTRIVKAAFTGQTITIRAKDENSIEFVDTAASAAANEKVDALREGLKDWIWKDVERRVYLERYYNETMNAWAVPEYDGSFLTFDGMMLKKGEAEFNLRKHQVDAIWRGIANGRGLYAHEVGTGKTYSIGGIAVESRRYGLAQKPLILGHNANSASVAADIQTMYPGAKVLYIDNLSPNTIDQKLYQIANDDWDAVVLPHSLLDRLALSKETLDRLAQDEIMALEEEAIASAEEEGFDIGNILNDEEALRKIRGAATAKELVKQRNRIIQNIEKQAQAAGREGAIPFERLGVDMIIIDEAHEFKKPPLSTRMNVKGLNTGTSNRSIALNFLTSYVKQNNGGRGVHIFTGTPITNTLNEIYNHMRYVMSDEMDKADVLSWDAWFNTFASIESDIERTASGDYETVARLSGFHNVSELRRFAGQFMDIVFADEMPEFVPRQTKSGKDLHDQNLTDVERNELLNGRVDEGDAVGRPYKKLINEVAEMSGEQREILETLIKRANSFKGASGKERREIMLSGDPRNPVVVETDAAKAGFDPRLYNKELSDHPENKINRCVTKVLEHYAEHEKASQVIFMEKGYSEYARRTTRGTDGGKSTYRVETFNAAKDLKDKLMAGGIPENEIAIVNGSVSKDKRKEISDSVNAGEIRVVIGLTSTLGTGTNMQENLRAMHHLDAPWMPGELEQRNGRGHRQGNRWNTVFEYRYITESIDARRWQVLAKKQKIIVDFLKAKDGIRSIEGDVVDLGASDLDEINSSFSEAAGDARILIREKLKKDIERLEKKKRTHGQGIVEAKEKIKAIEDRELPALKEKSQGIQSDIDAYHARANDSWAITINGKQYTERQKANVALEKLVLKYAHQGLKISEQEKIGEYRGFDILVQGALGKGNNYFLKRDLLYPIQPATGSIDYLTRNFANLLEKTQTQITEKENALEKFGQVVKEQFAHEAALKNKKELLDQVEQDLASNPDAPPSWLTQGTPIGTEIYYEGKSWEVEGHRKGDHGYYVIVKHADQQEVIHYLEVMDENNLPVYEAREGDLGQEKKPGGWHPDIGVSGFSQQTIDGLGRTEPLFSTDADAGQYQAGAMPGQGVSIQDIQKHFKGQQAFLSPDGSISIRFKNGKGCRIKNVEHIGGDDVRYAMETGRMGEDGIILGKYQDQTITLNKNFADTETLTHETLHLLKDLGVLTQADLMSLDAHRAKLVRDGRFRYEVLENREENQANTLAQLIADRQAYRDRSALNRIIQKVMDFLNGLIFIGSDAARARSLAREMETGKIYGRETNGQGESTPSFQTAGNTDSEAFKKWFGKSVGKTRDGKPVSFFHGTPNTFTVFEDRPGESTTHTASGLGHFFTMDKSYASAYAKGTGNVMEVYLKMEKPYKMSLDEAQSFNTVTDAIVKKRRLKLRGYDSVIIPIPGAQPMIVIFNSNQIKSVANRGTWDINNPDIRFSTSVDAVSTKEKEITYKQMASGLKNVITNRKKMGPDYKEDISVVENILGLMSHYSEKIPAMKRTFNELLKRPELKFQKENELSKNGEQSLIGVLSDLQKHDKRAYAALKDYLIDRDINQIGAVLFQDEDGSWTIKSPKDERTGKRSVLEEGISTKKKARDLAIQYEIDEYPDLKGRDALLAFRTMTANLHDHYAESWETLIREYEDRGLALPRVVTRTKAGEVRIDLKAALAKMGDRSSYYFPRQRSNGYWQVVATKKGEHDFIEYRDFKATADYLAGKMKSQGYDVKVEKVGSLSEDVYQDIKNILSTQAMVNQALAETKMDAKIRTLGDIGLSGEWRGDDYFIPQGGVYEWSSSVLKELGGREYSDLGKRGNSWSPGYWFENAPKDIEEIVTNALYVARGQETDISFEIGKSLVNQLADTLRARGSRARMISRSDAVGKDVPIGYETDPLKAIAQAVNSAAGGYAKQQVALNTSKAITGQHYTWDEWQQQHPDYFIMVAAEDALKDLQKNTRTEEERIADIDREIQGLYQEQAGVKTESDKARQDRLFRIGALFREKEKIRKWKDDQQAAALHQEIARLRGNIHKAYQEYIQANMIDPKRQKRAYTDAVNAVENVLKNDEAGDRVINTLKGLASVWFLGGRLSSAAINLTAMGTTVPAAMDAYGGIPLQRTIQHIAKAGKIYASFVTGKGNVSKDDRAVLEDIFSRGWVAAQLNMETINALKSGPAQKYSRAVELLMTPFKITEEFNRGTTILAAYKGIMAENPGMNKEEALMKAKTVSDRAHGIYGVENQPALLRKGRGLRAASAMYIFQTFMHNYFTTLAYMIGRRQAKAATYMILSPMVFGGAASSLVMPAIKLIFKALDEDDPEEKIYQIAQDLFGEAGGDVARYGLPGLAGISLKGSLAPNMPDFQEPLDALGPIGGMMRNIYDGAVNITHGDYLKGVEKITPLAMGNVAKAYREASQGVTTRAGDPVFFGNEQIKGDIGTGIMRAAGLNPTKIAKPREIQWNETTLKQQYIEKKRMLYSRIIHYHTQSASKKNPTEWQDILMDVRAFNARVKSNGLDDIVPMITGKTIKNRIRLAFRPNKRERGRVLEAQ